MTTKHILFVCTGNTCRSPLAEGLCRMMAKREGLSVEVRSAGVSATDGTPVSRHSGDILRQKGAAGGLSGSRFLRKDEVVWADLILTMTMSHKRMVLERHPDAVDKIYTLKEFVQEEDQARADSERHSVWSELQLKQALGQPLTPADRELLRQMGGTGASYDISDPFGGNREEYEQVSAEIERAVAGLLRKLKDQSSS